MEKKPAPVNPARAHQYEGFWAKICMVLGLCQIIIGVVSMIMNGIGIYFHAHLHNYGQGIWCGAIFFISGFAAVIAGHFRTRIPVVVALVSSIVSAVMTIPMLGITAAGIDYDRKQGFNYWVKDYAGVDYLDGKNTTRQVAHAMLLTLSLLELVVAVITSLLCIHAVKYCNRYNGASHTEEKVERLKSANNPYLAEAPVTTAASPNTSVYPPGDQSQHDMSPYPVKPTWNTNQDNASRVPPVVTPPPAPTPSFQPLNAVNHDTSNYSHRSSHNTSVSSSFTPLHMIQPNPYSQPSGPYSQSSRGPSMSSNMY